MNIAVDREGDVTVVTVPVEELDAGNSGELKRELAPVLHEAQNAVFDLSRVRFIDSSGLGAMLSCLRQLSGRGGDLKLCGLTQQVRATFELVRLDRIFDIHDRRAEAVRAFGR